MQFRLQSILLFCIIVWSAMAAIGTYGILLAMAILSIVICLRIQNTALGLTTKFFCGLASFAFVAALIRLLLPDFEIPGRASTYVGCSNRLKQIMSALHDYRTANGSFPPSHISGPKGELLHSWRTLILPFVDEKRLYSQFNLVEPWDGPNNNVLPPPKYIFDCPTYPSSCAMTAYLAVVGSNTAWQADKPWTIARLPFGGSRTIILVELMSSQINWSEPRDLTVQEAIKAIQAGPHLRSKDYFHCDQPGVTNVVFADGRVASIPAQIPIKTLELLLTVDKNEVSPKLDELLSSVPVRPAVRLRWDRIISLILLIMSSAELLRRAVYVRGNGDKSISETVIGN